MAAASHEEVMAAMDRGVRDWTEHGDYNAVSEIMGPFLQTGFYDWEELHDA